MTKLAAAFGRLKMAQWRGVPFGVWVTLMIIAALVDAGLIALVSLK